MPRKPNLMTRQDVICRHNLPVFDLPQLTPKSRKDVHLLCYALVEHINNSHDPSSIPRRMVQRELTISDGKPLSRRLKQLDAQGWVKQNKSNLTGRAATYEPGIRLSSNPVLEKEWLEFSASLHGDHGLLKYFRHRPSRAHGHLNINGLIILATLEHAKAAIRVTELGIYLQPLMTPRTVKKYLKRLITHELVTKSANGYQLESDWEIKLEKYESVSTTATERKQRIRQQTFNETRKFHQEQNPDGKLSKRSLGEWRWFTPI